MSRVLVMDSTYDTCREAVDKAFAAFPLDLSGKKVAVKINALKACDPDREAMVTHYKVVKAVVDKVESLGPAEMVVGDSVGTQSYGNSETVFRVARLKEAAGRYYRNFNKRLSLITMKEPFERKVAVLKDVLDADVYISVPKMKTHGQTMISGGMKNNFGLLPGAQKSWFHYSSGDPQRFARVIVEMFRLRPPDLVIMDAILAMEGYGPSSPETRWVNKILASNDAVALDTVQAKIIGYDVREVSTLTIARDLGLGETDLRSIKVIGDASMIAEYHRPTPPESSFHYKSGIGGRMTSIDFFRERIATRPVISPEKCAPGCRECVEVCPSGALVKGSNAPVLDSSRCILCSACKEACDHEALELRPDAEVLSSLT